MDLVDRLRQVSEAKQSISLASLLKNCTNTYWYNYSSCSRFKYFYNKKASIQLNPIMIDIYLRNLGVITELKSIYDLQPLDRYNAFTFNNQYLIVDVRSLHMIEAINYCIAYKQNQFIFVDSETLISSVHNISDKDIERFKVLNSITILEPKVSKNVNYNYCKYCPFQYSCNTGI
jgi:hypothetical protein